MDLVPLACVCEEESGLSTLGLRKYHWLAYVRKKVDLVPLACVCKEQSGLGTLGLRT